MRASKVSEVRTVPAHCDRGFLSADLFPMNLLIQPLQPDMLRRELLYPTLGRLQIPRELRAGGFPTFPPSACGFVKAPTGKFEFAQKVLGHSHLRTTGAN